MRLRTSSLSYWMLAGGGIATVFPVVFPSWVLAQGCAMCKTALSGPEDPLAIGIFWSAMLMMSMPFILFASIGGWIFYQYRSADRPAHPPAAVLPFETGSIKK